MPRDVNAKIDEVGETLLRAADLLETEGWCQKSGRKDGKRCAAVAIEDAAPSYEVEDSAWLRVYRALGGTSIVCWNDAPGRTQEDVTAFLRSVAYLPGGI